MTRHRRGAFEHSRPFWRLATLIAAVAGCSRPAAHDGATVKWTDPVTVSAATGGGAAPILAVSPMGAATLAWVGAPKAGTDGRLYVRAAARPDSVFELRDPLGSLSISGEVPPKITYGPNGTLYVAYLVTKVVPGEKWPQNALRFASSRDGGAHWANPATVTGGKEFGSYDDHALHVARDGTIYLSWLAEASRDTSHTYFSRSIDGGTTWSAPIVIDRDLACPCCRTAMTTSDDGTVYVAWRKRYQAPGGEERDIVVARSNDRGATWSAPVRVHTDAWRVEYCPDAGPSIKSGPDGVLHVAWWTGKPGSAGTQYARSTDGGRTFGAPVPLGLAQQSRAAHVQIALGNAGGEPVVVAAWDDGTRMVPQIVVRVSRDGGRTFGSTQAVSSSGNQAGYPVVMVRGDTVLVAWQERSLAAAMADSSARAKSARNDASDYVTAVGALQVVARSGVLAEVKEAPRGAAFRPLAVGEAAPPYAVATLAGDTVHIGGRSPITVLNVWATWCTSCREEMADLGALHRELAPRGVRVIGVSVDASGGARVRRFAEEEKLEFTIAHDREQRVQALYRVVGVPETLVIDGSGRLLWRWVGNLHPVVDSVRAVISAALVSGG